MTRMHRRWLVAGTLASGMTFGLAGLAMADDFPSEPLTMVIPFGSGGSTDIQGRVLANVLEDELGQPVNVVNQPGAGGGVALTRLANNSDEGYTFIYGPSSPITFGPLATPTDYAMDDFRYVASVSLAQAAIVTGEDRPFGDSWEDLLEYARENPGVSYATQTAQDRLIIDYIAEQEDLDLRVVPTEGGSGMAPLILSGDVDFGYSGGTHSGYADSGEMPVMLSLAADRLVAFPDAPTLVEAGYDITPGDILMAIMPADVPDERAERLEQALANATEDERFIEVTEERLLLPVDHMDEATLSDTLYEQAEAFAALIEEMGGVEE